MKYQDNLNRLVGRIGSEYWFVDYVFNDTLHGTPFHGATGTILIPVSEQEAEECLTSEYIDQYLEDAGADGLTSEDISVFEWPDLLWDSSGSGDGYWDALYDHEDIPITPSNTPYFTCIGCGRIFHKDTQFDEVYDQELLDRIMKFETH